MFARVTTLRGPGDQVDQGITTVRDQVLPAARQMDGFRGMLALADRSAGTMIGITLWESEAALQASEEAANQLRSDSAAAGGAEVVSVERYEVVIDEPT